MEFDISNLQQIGSPGYEYNVYALNDEQVLKVSTGCHFQNSGAILNDLQGLPFIPEVYDYGEDWLIMKRIHGIQLGFYCNCYSWFNIQYDANEHRDRSEKFYYGSLQKGWEPKDLHIANVMLDENGAFWIVDVGAFKKTHTLSNQKDELNKLINYGHAISRSFAQIEWTISLLGKDKVYEICHPKYW